MRDRFADFQRTIDHFDEVELNPSRPPSTSNRLAERIQDVRAAVISLGEEVSQLKRHQNHVLSSPDVNVKDKDALENHISAIRRRVGQIRKAVKEVDDEFADFAKNSQSRTQVKIQQNQIDDVRRRLLKVIEEFNSSQTDYRSRVSVRVRRQLEAVGEHVSVEDVDKMLSERGQDLIFFRQVNPLSVSGKAAVADVKQRHDEIFELEKSIGELHECYLDLNNLVQIQGETVDNIAQNVELAVGQVEQGARHTKKAAELKKSALKKKIFVYGLLLTVLLILIAVAIILAVVLSGRK